MSPYTQGSEIEHKGHWDSRATINIGLLVCPIKIGNVLRQVNWKQLKSVGDL